MKESEKSDLALLHHRINEPIRFQYANEGHQFIRVGAGHVEFSHFHIHHYL